MIFFDQNTLFFTLEPYHSILSIRIFVLWEKKFVVEIYHLVVNPPTLCYPFCVEVDFWSGGFVPYPSSERLIGWLCAHPSFMRLICGGFVPCL